jgi:hypothetical protein
MLYRHTAAYRHRAQALRCMNRSIGDVGFAAWLPDEGCVKVGTNRHKSTTGLGHERGSTNIHRQRGMSLNVLGSLFVWLRGLVLVHANLLTRAGVYLSISRLQCKAGTPCTSVDFGGTSCSSHVPYPRCDWISAHTDRTYGLKSLDWILQAYSASLLWMTLARGSSLSITLYDNVQ